jgi:hypothetical protein
MCSVFTKNSPREAHRIRRAADGHLDTSSLIIHEDKLLSTKADGGEALFVSIGVHSWF